MRIPWLVCALLGHAAIASADEASVRAEAERVCGLQEAGCDWLATLGTLERESVDRAIKERHYVLEPSPWGKTVASVRVYNEDVFAEDNWLQFLNNLHYTTRESATYDEIVIHEGEVWDQAKVEESARLLRDPLFSSVVVVLPAKSAEPGKVDLLVVTRDIWSLRLNTNYTFQVGKLTNLSFSVSENNFLGNHNVLALAFAMDQSEIATGPLFVDKSVLGKHVTLSARVDDIFNRDAFIDHGKLVNEGSDSSFVLSRPLWSLASEWSAAATFSHSFSVIRRYQGTSIRPYDDPDTSEVETIPTQFEFRRWGTSVQASRQLGTDIKHQITVGYSLNDQHPSFLPDFSPDPALRGAFARDLFPHSEVTSTPFVSYTLYTPTYRTLRNVGTYDLVEDVRMGPQIDASLAFSLRALGSDTHFTAPTLGASYTLPWCHDGYVRGAAAIAARIDNGNTYDDTASGSVRVVTPATELGRIVAQSTIATRWHDTTNAFIAIGGDPTLRAFTVNQFAVPPGASSSRLFSTQIEARTIAAAFGVEGGNGSSRRLALGPRLASSRWLGVDGPIRVGAVLFYEIAGVGESFATMRLHHDVGVGIRVLIPQTARDVFRFDVPVALDGATAGHPHFIASYQSAF